jgi:rod shape-determining protein MreC
MPLGTLDRTPPPFFRQGPSAATQLGFFTALALFLMVADTRMELVRPLREGVAVALLPLQRAAAVPVEIWQGGGEYLQGLQQALEAQRRAGEQLAAQSLAAQRAEELAQENERLRALLALQPALPVRALAAEVLHVMADPFSRKVVIDRGQTQGVALGAPVINHEGVLGQVTRLFALTAEVTLLADEEATIPVLNQRTQQLGVAQGGSDALSLRFLSANADVQVGDELRTSGVDGIYPPGLAVGRVTEVQRRVDSGFARVQVAPAARSDHVRHVLVLEPLALQRPPAPAVEAAGPQRPSRRGTEPVGRRAAP